VLRSLRCARAPQTHISDFAHLPAHLPVYAQVESGSQTDVEHHFKITGDLRAVTVVINIPDSRVTDRFRAVAKLAAEVCDFLKIHAKKRPRALDIANASDIDVADVAIAIDGLLGKLEDARQSADDIILEVASNKEAAEHRGKLKIKITEFLNHIREGAADSAVGDGIGTVRK